MPFPALLRATASLNEKPAIFEAISLLSKYSQANQEQYCGVQEAQMSLRRLQAKLPSATGSNAHEPYLPPSNEPRGPIDSSDPVHQYNTSDSQLRWQAWL
jgi:hypothetical protein